MKIIIIYDMDNDDIFYYIPDTDSPEPVFIEPHIEREDSNGKEDDFIH